MYSITVTTYCQAFIQASTSNKLLCNLNQTGHFGNTVTANQASLEFRDIIGIIAKYTAGLILLKDDSVTLGKDLKRIGILDMQYSTNLLRYNDASH